MQTLTDSERFSDVLRGGRILLAERSPLNRSWLRAALSRVVGAEEVREVDDASELLAHLAEGGYDLVVCPRELGASRGTQILAMARTAGLDTPFLLIAPFSSDKLRAQVARLAPAEVLDDPLDAVRLCELAKHLLAGETPPEQQASASQ